MCECRSSYFRSDDAVLVMVTNYRKGKRVLRRILPFLDVVSLDLLAKGFKPF